jgi:hypothetical protein
MPKGIKITTDKVVEDVDVNTLAEYQAIVGGLIQPVPMPRAREGGDIIVNEEGKLIGLPFNSIATDVALLAGSIPFTDAIVGDALVIGPVRDGSMTDVTDAQRAMIERVAREA